MGRYDFRPSRVLGTAKELLAVGRFSAPRPWMQAVTENAPPQILVRSQPVQHTGYVKQRPTRKLRKQYIPQKITYPEDNMRRSFFKDHPWELARPRILLEGVKPDDGDNWERIRPEGLGLQPENVIRRQLWLIEHENQDPQTAYNTARREFYRERFREDIERKVAKEEALHSGAYFGKSTLAWAMELEDRKFHGFKQWAGRLVIKRENRRQAQLVGGDEAALGLEGSRDGGGANSETAADDLIERDEQDTEELVERGPRSKDTSGKRASKRRMQQPVSDSDGPEPEPEEDNGGASLRM